MIVLLQFDAAHLPLLESLRSQGRLPTLAKLYERGRWVSLETPAVSWEGATYFTLYSGLNLTEHGLYFPFMWSASEQRVRSQYSFPAPQAVWDRAGQRGRLSLVIDPYEGVLPQTLKGKAISGWQFRHKVTLQKWSVPPGLNRRLSSRFGRPPLIEEVYGRPMGRDLLKMRSYLLEASKRAADAATTLLSRENFDLVWITLCAPHLAGHWFFDPSRLPRDQLDGQSEKLFYETLSDTYCAVDDALSCVLSALPRGADLIILSPSGMGPNTSRCHILPGMLQAVLDGKSLQPAERRGVPGSFLWRLRANVPREWRAWVARVLPDHLTLELTARLEMRGVDWSETRAFMVPSGDCGYIRLNLRGREREGILDIDEADKVMEQIASGLGTFRDPDGMPTVKRVEFVSRNLGCEKFFHGFPDLIVHWSEKLPAHMAGVSSPEFGDVPSPGWGSGRTGEHSDGAWALVVPGASNWRAPVKRAHVVDIAATVLKTLNADAEGLPGQSLLEPVSPA